MQERHVPVLCGSCRGAHELPGEHLLALRGQGSSRPVLGTPGVLEAPEGATWATVPAGSLRHPCCRPVGGVWCGGPARRRDTQPSGRPRPLAARTCGGPRPYQAGDAGARRRDRCRRRRLSPADSSPRRVRQAPRCRAREALPQLNYRCAAAGFANSESASVWRAPRGSTITGQAASRTRRPATPPTRTACVGP